MPAYFALRRSGRNRAGKGVLWTTIAVFGLVGVGGALLYLLVRITMPRIG
jgi:hypothetical protein